MSGKVDEKLDGSIEVRLILARHLDRERRDIHRVTVVAVDGGLPAQTGSLDVSVVVLDANEKERNDDSDDDDGGGGGDGSDDDGDDDDDDDDDEVLGSLYVTQSSLK